jgi:hypothetical protein
MKNSKTSETLKIECLEESGSAQTLQADSEKTLIAGAQGQI